jgi:hypothetical protein
VLNGADTHLPAWSGRWQAGLHARAKVSTLPPEHVILDPADILDPNGFQSGWMLSGVAGTWKQATGTPDTKASTWYVSSKQLLFAACRHANLLEGTGARLRWSEHAHNPIAADLPAAPHCGSGTCNGDYDCDDCGELQQAEWFDPGQPATLHASDLYRLCDQLFPQRPDGWQQLSWQLRHLGSAARDVAQPLLMERWARTLPTVGRLRDAQNQRTLSGWQVACGLADALVTDIGANDEECALVAHLAAAAFDARLHHDRRGVRFDTIPELLIDQLEVARAALR